jgi:hypothetical protein
MNGGHAGIRGRRGRDRHNAGVVERRDADLIRLAANRPEWAVAVYFALGLQARDQLGRVSRLIGAGANKKKQQR